MEVPLLIFPKVPFALNLEPILQFLTFSFLNCPPNFLWLEYLEEKFPSTKKSAAKPKSDDEKLPVETEGGLDIRNTAIKFAIDQTLGASFNTVFYIAVMGALKGLRGNAIIEAVKDVRLRLVGLRRCFA